MKYLLFFIGCSFSLFLFAQEDKLHLGGNVNLNYSQKLTNRLSLKMSAEHRSASRQGSFTTESRQDVAMGLQRSFNSIFKVAVGGMYRNSNFDNKQRLFQQLGMLQSTLTRVRLVHRLRVDETFSTGDTEYRLRYRFGFDMPSRGYRLDPGEGYIAVLSEFLGKFKGTNYKPEYRLATQFGHLFKNKNKGELEIEFRYDDPFGEKEKLLVFGFGYYFNK